MRGSQVLKDLLGEPFAGYLVSDRRSAYRCFRQKGKPVRGFSVTS